MLKLGECLGMNWANERIVISQVIQNLVEDKYGKESVLIPNGVVLPELPDKTDASGQVWLIARKICFDSKPTGS